MEQIAQQLVNQVLEEKQVYLDNARLKHGVPRHKGSPATGVAMPSQNEPAEQPAATSMPQVTESAPKKTGGSFLKTAATIGLAAAAGAVGIPPIVTSIAGSLFSKTTDSAPKEPSGGSAPASEEWNDLVNWIREEKLDK